MAFKMMFLVLLLVIKDSRSVSLTELPLTYPQSLFYGVLVSKLFGSVV